MKNCKFRGEKPHANSHQADENLERRHPESRTPAERLKTACNRQRRLPEDGVRKKQDETGVRAENDSQIKGPCQSFLKALKTIKTEGLQSCKRTLIFWSSTGRLIEPKQVPPPPCRSRISLERGGGVERRRRIGADEIRASEKILGDEKSSKRPDRRIDLLCTRRRNIPLRN